MKWYREVSGISLLHNRRVLTVSPSLVFFFAFHPSPMSLPCEEIHEARPQDNHLKNSPEEIE